MSLTDTADELKKTVQHGQLGCRQASHVKIVVRENRTGRSDRRDRHRGARSEARCREAGSVVIGTQLQQGARKNDHNPLVRDGRELVPNVTHVVSGGQHLYFYYEVYEPAQPVKVLTSIVFFRGRQRVFETPLVQTTELSAPDRKTTVFQFDVPASSLRPGLYTCQINVVDDAAGTFTFPRMQLYVRR